jgi:hypothetical protein
MIRRITYPIPQGPTLDDPMEKVAVNKRQGRTIRQPRHLFRHDGQQV